MMTQAGPSQQIPPHKVSTSEPRFDRAHCQLNSVGQITFWPPEAEFISGSSRLDVQGREFASFLSPEAATILRSYFCGDQRHQTLLAFLGRWERRNLELSVTPFQYADGTIAGHTVWMQALADDDDASVEYRAVSDNSRSATSTSKSLAAHSPVVDPYRILLNDNADAVILYTRDGVILDVNQRACEILGYSRDELIGQLTTMYAVSLSEKRKEEINQSLNKDASIRYEAMYRRRNGEEFPVEVKVSSFWHNDQILSVSIARDQSETYAERQRLEESEERLRLALDTVKLGTWRFVLGSGFATLDRRCQEQMGFSQADVAKEDLLNRVHPDDRQTIRDAMQNAIEAISKNISVGLEYRILIPDGTVRWLSVRAMAHFEGEGSDRRPVSLVGTTLDISRPKFAALSLRGQNSIFEAIAVGRPLDTILDEIIELIEAQIPDAICSILLLSREGTHLKFEAGRHLPAQIQQVCHHLEIGPKVGACGSAAWHRQSVIVADTLTDERFAEYRDVANVHSLRCCWSVPVFGSYPGTDPSVAPLLGTFAVYKSTPGIPDSQAQLALATGSRLASVAITTTRAVEETREAEERYSMISQITRSVTFAITINSSGHWHFDWSRPAFGLLSGYTHDEVNQIGWTRLIHSDDHSRIGQMMQQVRSGNVGRAEVRYHTKDGQTLFVQVHAKLQRIDPQNGSVTIIGGLLDISELKAVEQALRRNEERFQLALAGANDGLWDWNLQTNEVFYSPRWMQMLGYAAEELPGHIDTWLELLHPEESQKTRAQVQNFLRSNLAKFEIEYRLKHKDGSYRNILSRGQLARDEAGIPTRLVGTHQDLTERKQAEIALRRSESFLRKAQKIASLGRWEYDLKKRILEVCEETQRQFELPDGILSLQEFRELVHAADRRSVRNSMISMAHGNASEMEFRLQLAGITRWIVVKAAGGTESENIPGRIWGIVQDISERRQLEEQFRTAQKLEAFGQLAGGVAHDFNNLLTVINGSADMMLDNLYPDDPVFAGVSEIRDAGERAATLTRQLLVLSRQQFTETAIIDVNVVVSKAESMLRRLIGEHIQVETYLQDPLPAVQIGQGQLDQVLLNLAVNARDAMEDGGLLCIETRLMKAHELPHSMTHSCDVPCVRISVSDTGCGMSDDVKSRIFEPFFSTKGVGKGTGLGLATVYGVVQQNNGFVTVDSVAGSGTTFNIYFPAALMAANPLPSVIQEKPEGGKNETILLVEDEELVRQLTTRVLQSYGYNVIQAQSGEHAILMATSHSGPIHLLLTDVVMPGISGTELSSQLRKLFPDLRILFMSGYADDDVLRRGVVTQRDSFLQKPFTPTSLVRRVQELIQGIPSVSIVGE